MDCNSEELRWLITNSSEPLVFKNILKWNILEWTLKKWSDVLKNEENLVFRSGLYKYTKKPQWERMNNIITGNFDFFLNYIDKNESWLYFDYKHLQEWFVNIQELKNEIKWDALGFPDITAQDSTIWIGSKGSHTPCHIDTYGFNLIHQIYGKKMWLIFPPEQNLSPTRIPYEESSVYSNLNFFSPTVDKFKGIDNCRKIILEPGDVLLLPHHWWHYVENLETAISINTWIPLAEDDEERLKESITQFFVKQISDFSTENIKRTISNPNMDQILQQQDVHEFINIIFEAKKIYLQKHKFNKRMKPSCLEKSVVYNKHHLLNKHKFVKIIPQLSIEEFNIFLHQQCSRFEQNSFVQENLDEDDNAMKILKILTGSDVIDLITKKMLEQNI